MKKLIIMAAAITIGVIANAATCSWSANKIAYTEANPYVDSSTAGNYIAYLVDQSYANYASVDALVAALQKDGASAAGVIKSATGQDNEFEGVHTVKIQPGNTKPLDNEPQTYTSGMKINAYTVIFDASDPSKAANYMVAYKENLSFNNSLNLSAAFSSQADNEWHTVPEPTSGLLLLLGVAGLALRRRRA